MSVTAIQHREPVLSRQPEVEKRKLVDVVRQREGRGIAIAHPVHRVACFVQPILDSAANHGIVFDDEHAHGEPSLTRCGPFSSGANVASLAASETSAVTSPTTAAGVVNGMPARSRSTASPVPPGEAWRPPICSGYSAS